MDIKCKHCYGTIVNGVCQCCKATYAVTVDADKKNMLIDKMLEIAKMQYDSAGLQPSFMRSMAYILRRVCQMS